MPSILGADVAPPTTPAVQTNPVAPPTTPGLQPGAAVGMQPGNIYGMYGQAAPNPAQRFGPPGGPNTPPTVAPPVTPAVQDGTGGPQVTPYQNAFNNYLNSTGYQFMFGQGQNAITGSAAARGLLNSGATAKALEQYGQNIGSQYFDKYMNQLSNMNNTLGGTASAGQNALGQIATAGTAGGGSAANAMIQGASNQGAAIMQGGNAMSNMFQGLGNSIGGAMNSMGGTTSNIFGGLF